LIDIETKKHISSQSKTQAIIYYLKNDISERKISEIIGINERTFRRWLVNYKNGIGLERKNKIPISYKIKQKHVNYALKIIKKNQHISINKLWLKLKARFSDFDVTVEHLGVVVRNNNITRKRTKKQHYPKTRYGKPIDQKKQLKKFYSEVSNTKN